MNVENVIFLLERQSFLLDIHFRRLQATRGGNMIWTFPEPSDLENDAHGVVS